MIEEWRPIEGYEGLYEVSSLGRVRSLDRYDSSNHFRRGKILKLQTDGRGYLMVVLSSNNKAKMYLVHRMVAIAFIPNPDNLPEVNHRDENPSNDNVDNLEWCDRKYNNNYGSRIDRMRDTKLKNGTYTGLSEEEYNKKWYQENKDKLKEYFKKYRQENKEKISEWSREYMKKYYQENKDNRREYMKKYRQENKDKMNDYQREYRRKKKEEIQNNVKSLDDQI